MNPDPAESRAEMDRVAAVVLVPEDVEGSIQEADLRSSSMWEIFPLIRRRIK